MVVREAVDLFPRMQRTCLGRGPTDSNNSIHSSGFSVFSVILRNLLFAQSRYKNLRSAQLNLKSRRCC
jgi:hypothetical protein